MMRLDTTQKELEAALKSQAKTIRMYDPMINGYINVDVVPVYRIMQIVKKFTPKKKKLLNLI